MKPPRFEYRRPHAVTAAIELMRTAPDPRLLAGGQSLMPALRARETTAGTVVDVSDLNELRGVRKTADGLLIGAAEPMWELERSPLVIEHASLLVRALKTVGAPGIRSRATLGGSLCWADPVSQVPATLVTLGAVVLTSQREVPARDFITGANRTVLRPDELVTAVRLPLQDGRGQGFHLVRRTHITWPVAGAVARRAGSHVVDVTLFGAAPRPVLLSEVAAEAVAAAVTESAHPFDDARASATYRSAVIPVLAERAVRDALQ